MSRDASIDMLREAQRVHNDQESAGDITKVQNLSKTYPNGFQAL